MSTTVLWTHPLLPLHMPHKHTNTLIIGRQLFNVCHHQHNKHSELTTSEVVSRNLQWWIMRKVLNTPQPHLQHVHHTDTPLNSSFSSTSHHMLDPAVGSQWCSHLQQGTLEHHHHQPNTTTVLQVHQAHNTPGTRKLLPTKRLGGLLPQMARCCVASKGRELRTLTPFRAKKRTSMR